MRQSLYSRLLRQQSTPVRSNLENFLTEGLCDLLNRLSGECQRMVLTALLGPKALPPRGKDKVIRWETQQTIATRHGFKRPDLMGYLDKKPVYLVEVKVDAAFTSGRESEEDQISGEDVHQLKMYGQWLHGANPDAQLVLLTLRSFPPEDYSDLGNPHGYGTQHRHCIVWQQLYDSLAKVQLAPLVTDFRSFLQEVGMALDAPSRQDFALLELFMGGASARIRGLMSMVRQKLSSEFPTGLQWGLESAQQSDGYVEEPDNRLIWAWGMLNRGAYEHISWGVYFASGDEIPWGWQAAFPAIPNRPVLFVRLALASPAEANLILKFIPNALPWMHLAKGNVTIAEEAPVMAIVPLEEMLAQPDPATATYSWIKARFGELMQTVVKLGN